MRHVHSDRLERFLGAEQVAHISRCMNNPAAKWYGPHIAVGGLPRSRIYATRDGDFVGRLNDGSFMSSTEYWAERTREYAKRLLKRISRLENGKLNAGFASLDELIAAATVGGQNYNFFWQKAGVTGIVNGTTSLWGVGAHPAAGANAANAPGGEAPTDATTGAISFLNPTGGKTLHNTALIASASVGQMAALLYDRIFQVNKTMASTTNESVTGVPTRYQSSTPGAVDSAEGNFLMIEVGGTALAATAHNWNALYRDNGGTDAQTLPTVTGNSGAIVRRLDQPLGQWFCPLATGDTGIMDLNEIDCSASVATGVINFVIGHPIGWAAMGLAGAFAMIDTVNSLVRLERIFDDAALALLQPLSAATTATNWNVHAIAIAG
jgi:hypothetical protein